MKNRRLGAVVGLAVVTVLAGLGCSKSAEDCSYTASCGNSENDSGATCSPACAGSTPVCNESTKRCVECTKDPDCTATGKPFCDTTADECIQCKSNADCTNSTASVCIAGTCTGCTSDTDCTHIAASPLCKAATTVGAKGTCVACTTTNESACAGNSCNPATNACTNTKIGSVPTCHVCVADADCSNGAPPNAARCVALDFNGSFHANYCLQRADVGVACAQPYTVTFTSASLSGAASASNCGINQNATTCEAVLDMLDSKTCTASTNCGMGEGDGLCENISTTFPQNMRCTIPCSVATQCAAGQTCTNAANGYCR